LLINGLLTAKAGWGVYCFVVVRGGDDAGSGLRHGGPEPQARQLSKKNKVPFSTLAIEPNHALLFPSYVFT
jgi:hypothetical protein